MTISIIVAFSEGNIIGKNNKMPWKLSADLKRFKAITTGHTVVMGRKTYESIGKPLPNRKNIVLTSIPESIIDCITADSLSDAIAISGDETELFIIGGESVYKQTLHSADKLYVTEVHAKLDGDARFPEIDYSEWNKISREDHKADEKNQYDYSFVNYERKKK
ncbi:MAG: dihydrofolate reductase [Prevotellaceae bacterium]|jgi:dihydrofolate reductase|nr:dihydrofolate reductase [Prevotellaceae bacterium]